MPDSEVKKIAMYLSRFEFTPVNFAVLGELFTSRMAACFISRIVFFLNTQNRGTYVQY